jgi:hypothetical protein
MCKEDHRTYAVKVIKNLPAYIKQASLEKAVLEDVLIYFKMLFIGKF